jgi:ubiquinone/menaquinone biosynthesis C-methylase UbiE
MGEAITAGTAPATDPRTPMDWGRGEYERTAAALIPAAQAVIRAAHVHPGESAIDVGCGTGTVALLAARAGARVTAVDPADRLLGVARSTAEREGLTVQFLAGDAASLPVPDLSMDAVLSNFAAVFAPDPAAAIAEMARVLALRGRIVFSAWIPGGAVGNLNAAAMRLVRMAVGAPEPQPQFGWHDKDALAAAFAVHDLNVTVEEHDDIVFTAASPEAYLEAERTSHPMAIAGFEVLERTGQADTARAQLLRILQRDNEDAGAFRATSRYVVATATRN